MNRARPAVGALRLVMLLLMVGVGSASASGADWPFGAKAGGFGMRGGDYQNLGLLGAKARDADAPKPKARQPGGGRRRGTTARPTHDNGPQRLEIVLLLPEGPAAQAGLRIGDVVVGVGRRVFKEGALAPLAAALVKAESGTKGGILTLLVERDGERKKVEVAIPQGGKGASKPLKDAARLKIVERALAFLATQQLPGGGYKQTLSGSNGAVVQTALAGLAWLTAGSDPKQGLYTTNVQRAVDFVCNWCTTAASNGEMKSGGRGNWNQFNWGFAHAAIFLGEVHARTPSAKVKRTLHVCGAELVRVQEASGGWAHGPGGPNALGYVELNIVSGLALCGLGMAQQAGYVVPEETLAKAEAYLRASSGGGGVGYSAKPGQQGQGNIGRTAICWLGYVTLGKVKSAWAKKMRSFAEREAGNVLGGHASLMEHIFHAGVAAHAMGKSAKSRFWSACERDMILARAPDGSFQPRPWHESLGMGSNSDVTFGQIWTTATWTIVLGCEPVGKTHPGLPAWMGR